MKLILSILIVLILGTVLFGQTKGKSRNGKTRRVVQTLPKTSENKETKKSSTLPKSEWVIYREPKNIVLLYNPSTIVRRSNSVKIWTKRIVKDKNYYEMILMEIDCVEHQYRMLNFRAYDEDGTLLKSIEPNQSVVTPADIIPDSFTQTLELKVCKVVK